MAKIYLKEILKEKGITSKVFAEDIGVTAAAISNIITGRNFPTYDLLEKMANHLGVKMSTLLGEEPLKVVDSSKEFASFVRYKGIHYIADDINEFFKQMDELRAIVR